MEGLKIIISGGGTGGHIFPAIAIANAVKEKDPQAEILFVGANGRMEMEKVPQAGYQIKGLNIAGIQRSFSLGAILKNLSFPFKLINSVNEASNIIQAFKPDVVVGVGGYASGPVLWSAQKKGIPTLIQEQNGYAGITNKLLAKRAGKICVAYEGLEKYFPKDKIVFTGNPVRKDILDADLVRLPALLHYKFSQDKKTILVIGGSLGARTINESIAAGLKKIEEKGYQLIWQTGKTYFENHNSQFGSLNSSFVVRPFIKEMHWAYAAADVVISRAGALSISELCLVGKPAILVPSPNVAEDHQTKNAKALLAKNAALMVDDKDARDILVETALQLIEDEQKCFQLKNNIKQLGRPNAAAQIAQEIFNIKQS